MRISEHSLKSNRGFSLTEVMISAVVTVVIAMGVYQGLQLFQSSSKKIENSSTSLADTQQSGSYFTQVIESASMSYRIQHLPVPFSSCESTGPCVRKVVENKLQPLSSTDVSLLGSLKAGDTRIKSLEFFRDASGELFTQSGAIDVRGSPPVVLPNQMVSTNYYTTWPLYSELSKPFVIIRQKPGFSGYFAHYQKCALAAESKDTLDPYTIFTPYIGSNSDPTVAPSLESLKPLLNTMVLIYNSRSPDLYTVKLITEIPKPCIPDPKKVKDGKLENIPECNTCGDTKAGDLKPSDILVRLSEVNNFQLYAPSLTPSPSTWGAQSIYTFPTSLTSIQPRSGDSKFSDLIPPVHIKRFQHFINAFRPDSNSSSPYSSDVLYMIPISVERYSLVKSDPKNPDSPYNLVVKTYTGRDAADPETVITGSLRSQVAVPGSTTPAAGVASPSSASPLPSPSASGTGGPTEDIPAAVFIRKLGTNEMGVILNKSK